MRPVPLDLLPPDLRTAPTNAVPLDLLPPELRGAITPQPEESSGFLRQVADVPLGVAKGAVSGVGMLANLFGADTAAAKSIQNAEDYLNRLMSAEARNDQQAISQIMQEAEGKGALQEVKAALRAFATAPVDMLSQAAGTVAPALLAAVGAKVLGAGALVTTTVGAATGAGMGAGVVKGTIYDETKKALLDAGMSEEQAEARASLAQSYGGQNLDMILGGAALGGVASTTGVEKALIGPLSRRIMGAAAAKEAGEQAAQGLVRRAAGTAAAEAAPEFAQAAQEQLAANLALQREGLDRDLMAGVVGAGTLEALAGAGLGGIAGAVSRPPVIKPGAPVPPENLPPDLTAEPTLEPAVEPEAGLPPVIEPPAPPVAPPTAPVTPPAAPPATPPVTPKKPDGFVLQNRDRSTIASISQMNEIASAPNYGMVGFSRDFAVGAPVVSGAQIPEEFLGKTDYATTSDGRRFSVQYAVVPADSIVTSNDISGSINPLYTDQEALPVDQGLRAIAGNGRVAGLAESYKRGTAEQYKQELLADDLHGINPEIIQQIPNPVLVRVTPWDNLTADIGDVSNTTGVAGLSAVEQANNDVNRVDFGTLDFYENGEPTAQAVKSFVQAMPVSEQAQLLDTNGEPTAQAVDRFRAALFAKAYADNDLIRMFAQAQDPEARLVISALAQLAPDMARLEGLGALDIRPIIIDAVKIIIAGKRKNLSLQKISQQTDITVDPATRLVVDLFAQNPRSNKIAIESIRNATSFAYQEGTKESADMFGEVPRASRQDVLERLRRQDEQASQEIVEPTEGRGAPPSDVDGTATEPSAATIPTGTETGRPAKTEAEIKSLGQAQTGKPFTYQGFRGAGKTAEEIYAGAKVPVAGPGRYIAVSREDASMFGDQITEEPVTLENPLVIRTDNEWRALTRRAGWEFPNPFGLDEDTVRRYTDSLSNMVKGDGYDGLVIDPSDVGDTAKTLRNVFGISQIVDYRGAPQVEAKAEPPPVQISPEEQKQKILDRLRSLLSIPVLDFRMVASNGRRSTIRPRPLSDAQIKQIVGFASEAIELGMPASLLSSISSGGVTGMKAVAAIGPKSGYFLLGNQWAGANNVEKLTTVVHEIGHIVDWNGTDFGLVSKTPSWDKAHDELKAWYGRDSTPKNPLSYPFSKTFDKAIPDKRIESFPEAFAQYFVSPVQLQTNAPTAYSAIQSIVEGIQNESTRAAAAGAAAPTTTGVQIQPSRIGEGPEVQPDARQVGADIARAGGVEDRGAVGEPDGNSYFSQEAFDDVNQGRKSRSIIIQMSPDDFLRMAEPGFAEDKYENVKKLADAGTKFTSLPRLFIDDIQGRDVSKVVGHEGRHRAMLLRMRGVKSMPVEIRGNIRWSEQQDPDSFDYWEKWPTRLEAEKSKDRIAYPVQRDLSVVNVALSMSPEDKRRADMERDLFRLTPAGQIAEATGVQGDLFGATGDLAAPQKPLRRKAVPEGQLPLLGEEEIAPSMIEADERNEYPTRRNVFGQPVKAAWGRQNESKFDTWIFRLQDKYVDVKRVQEQIRKTGKEIADRWNVYLKEELFHGRSAKKTKDFLFDELDPLMREMEKRGVGMAEFEEYLHNRTAETRNKLVAERDPENFPDGGSGILTADAKAYLDGLNPNKKADYEALANMVDKITKKTRQLLVDSGHESKETIEAWEKSLPFYVPLNRAEAEYELANMGTGVGQGFAVRGKFARAVVGSDRPVVDILANIAMQRERAIVRTEKMRVGQALYGLVLQNPNPGFWLAVDPEAEANPRNIEGITRTLIAMGFPPMSPEVVNLQNLMQALMKQPTIRKVNTATNQVVNAVNEAMVNSPYALPVRINGVDKYIFFNPQDPIAARMAESLRNVDADQMDKVLGPIAKVTRYFAAINTQYNPIFGVINFMRDVQGALIQLTNTPLAGKQKDVMAKVMPALRGIYADLRARRDNEAASGEYVDLWNRFQDLGGQTGFRDQFSRSDERADALYAVMNPAAWTETGLGKIFTANGKLKVPLEAARKSVAKPIFDWLSDYNETMENAIRLAAFKTALDSGMTDEQAASVAKNLTVNFNRKGLIGKQAGALYAFFNASVQGTARMAATLFIKKDGKVSLSKTGKTIFYGGLLLGSAQAMLLAAAGFDEDEPPQFIRERNIVIPLPGGKYVTIPMPLGYNVIPNTSRILTEWAMSGFQDTPKRVAGITSALLDMFNPIGNAGWSWQTFSPTIADPAVALFENRDWTGKPIAKEDFSSLDPSPGYTRARETASWFSKNLSEFLNLATGGTKDIPGLVSPTPDQIDYLIGQLTGGVGRELLKAEQTVTSAVTGEELPAYKIPLVGRFVGDTTGQAAVRNQFYENLLELNLHQKTIEGRRERRENVQEYFRENPEARLYKMADKTQRNVSQLRKRREMLIEKGASKEQVQAVEKQITLQMQRLNDAVDRLKQ